MFQIDETVRLGPAQFRIYGVIKKIWGSGGATVERVISASMYNGLYYYDNDSLHKLTHDDHLFLMAMKLPFMTNLTDLYKC